MESREEDVEMDEDGTIQVEGAGSSSTSGRKTTRSGSPVPPKILYKSTTGKGVAFTSEDVQYLMDYLEYRTCVFYTINGCNCIYFIFQREIGGAARHGRVLE
jgi:hypothetical protein